MYDAEKWKKVKTELFERDMHICRLTICLSRGELANLREKAGGFLLTLDPAHIFPRSTYPELSYEIANMVVLNRYSHSMIDEGKDPIMGWPISRAEIKKWWQRIAGISIYDYLLSLSENRRKK